MLSSSNTSNNIIIANSIATNHTILPSQLHHYHHQQQSEELTTINPSKNLDNNINSNIINTKANNVLGTNSIANNITNNNLWFELPKMDNFVDIFSICCSTAVIFGGLVPYIPQYLKIKQSMNSDGFSTYVCLTLLIANILRIMFWFGHHFELPLLIQSFVMIAGMLAMMEICVRVRDKDSSFTISSTVGAQGQRMRRRFRFGFNLRYFWNWDEIYSYVEFLCLFTFVIGLLTYFLLDNYLYVESLGFLALFTESALATPQLFKNYVKKSTRGMSAPMVWCWLIGDVSKTLYFIIKKAPIQFYICGSIQVIVDILIISQVVWYRRPNVNFYRKLTKR